MFFLLLRKTHLNPSTTQIPSLLCITSRLFSNPSSKTPDKPSSTSYDELINKAAHSKDLSTIHRLINKRYKDGFFNTSNTFNFLTTTNMSTHLNDLIQTLSTLDKGYPQRNTFDHLIARLCKLNRIPESLHIIDTMVDKQIELNPFTFHPILDVVTRRKEFDEAWKIIEKMKSLGLAVDITSCNFILASYCYVGDLIGAARVLKEIDEQGLKADAKTYDSLVMVACKGGKLESVLVLLRRMEEEGVSPLYATHLMVIKTLLRLGCWEKATEFVMTFAGRNKGLDNENFGYLGFHLIKKKRVEEVKLVLGEMEKRGLVIGDKLRSQYNDLLLDSN